MTALLSVDQLGKEFGGVHAVEDLSFQVEKGRIHSIIGPNGAGKTTLFNLITGLYQPSSGGVHLNGRSLAGHQPHELAPLGMCRTFQNLQICMNMTALENVMLGRHRHLKQGTFRSLFAARPAPGGPAMPGGMRRADGIRRLRPVHPAPRLGDALRRPQASGNRPRAGVLPDILLLDEPAAGLNRNETDALRDVIRRIADKGITVVLVEHDMKLVMSISDQVLVLCYGRKLAEGTRTRSAPTRM